MSKQRFQVTFKFFVGEYEVQNQRYSDFFSQEYEFVSTSRMEALTLIFNIVRSIIKKGFLNENVVS